MMQLVATHADWWNLPVHQIHRMEELRPSAGSARVSLQQMVTFVPDPATRAEVLATADARFGTTMGRGAAVGDGPELVDHFGALAETGVERVYTWFTDFAAEATLAAFGEQVIGALA